MALARSAETSPRRSTRPSTSTRSRFVLDGEPTGVERAGPWVFSRDVAGRARGASSARGSTRPTRSIPGVPLPSEPWAADVAAAPPVRAPRREALPAGSASRRSRARDEDGRRARARARRGRRAGDEGRGRRARALPRGARAARPARRRLRDRRRTRSRSRRTCSLAECRVGGRDHARALPRPRRHRDGATRSSSSSGSTRTGSRAESATGGYLRRSAIHGPH